MNIRPDILGEIGLLPSNPGKERTVTEYLVMMCENRGMFHDQATEVVKDGIKRANKGSSGYTISWDSPVSEYAPVVIGMVYMYIKNAAIDYINEHCPKAWFRPLFTIQDYETH